MLKCLWMVLLYVFYANMAYAILAGGRPNAFSEGNNAFAGVVNPANAVWIADRFDLGAFWVYQKSQLKNRNDNPNFPLRTTSFTYKSRNIVTSDIAIHKKFKLNVCEKDVDSSFSLAAYTVPNVIKIGTKVPFPLSGTTPIRVRNKVNVISAVFSFKLCDAHSVGFTVDYLIFSHLRNGFQRADNALRSVSPGHVTNNGTNYSSGVGCSIGWRWNISKRLNFGAAWTKKSYGGQYRRYRGYEPHHAKNFIPQSIGGGFNYRFTTQLAGRLEFLWTNFGNLPNANNNVLPNGQLNLNKRGSKKSPGPGLQDATFINFGLGYKWNSILSLGAGFSHRIKHPKSSNFLSHTYIMHTVFDILTLGVHLNYEKHELFISYSHGFKNRVTGFMPPILGGGKFVGEKENCSFSLSWGYRY